MKLFKVAIVQHNRDAYDQNKNIKDGLSHVQTAKDLGADIVLFPECWITGYEFPDINSPAPMDIVEEDARFKAWFRNALDDNSWAIKQFCDIAKKLSIGVVITGYTKGKTRPQNSALIIDRTGSLLLKYSKVHTCDFASERMLENGEEFKVCEFDNIKIGIMICYDREYPESARVLMLKGAELILVPNDCGSMAPRNKALSTRAYENMVGIAMANPPGENAGCSCAYSPIVWDQNGIPIDNTIVLADAVTEDILIATFDLDALRAYRKREMLGNTFRKPKAYKELLNEAVQESFIRS